MAEDKKQETSKAPAKPETSTKKNELPKSVTLAKPYGFYDESEKLIQWAAGEVVEIEEDIKLLFKHKAPLVDIDHGNEE